MLSVLIGKLGSFVGQLSFCLIENKYNFFAVLLKFMISNVHASQLQNIEVESASNHDQQFFHNHTNLSLFPIMSTDMLVYATTHKKFDCLALVTMFTNNNSNGWCDFKTQLLMGPTILIVYILLSLRGGYPSLFSNYTYWDLNPTTLRSHIHMYCVNVNIYISYIVFQINCRIIQSATSRRECSLRMIWIMMVLIFISSWHFLLWSYPKKIHDSDLWLCNGW